MNTTTKPPIEFRTKAKLCDGRPYIVVPMKLGQNHCNMHAFRNQSRIYGAYANSDMFHLVLERGLRAMGILPGMWFFIDEAPEGVTIDTSGFLAVVSVDLPLN